MNKSDSIKELAAAMSKAQAMIEGALKHSENSFYKKPGGGVHKYADLESVWDAIRPTLEPTGLSLIQFPISREGGVGVESILTHKSGEWISNEFVLPLAKQDAQGGASCITYCRRYSAAAIFGVVQEDDDGNAAAAKQKDKAGGHGDAPMSTKLSPEKAATLAKEGVPILEAAAAQGMEQFVAAWKRMSGDMREACAATKDRLKAQLQGAANEK